MNNKNYSEENKLSWNGLDLKTKIFVIVALPIILFMLPYAIYVKFYSK
jgi:hypothetical protein